jgi:hypothetical protein
MFIPMWVVYLVLAIVVPAYLLIGFMHFALNRGTAYSTDLRTDLYLLFLWPIGWIKGLISMIGIFFPVRKCR